MNKNFKLEHSMAPFIGINVIPFVILTVLSYSAILEKDLKYLYGISIILIFMIFWYFIQSGYKVWVEEDTIYCRASDYKTITKIAISDIKKIKIESNVIDINKGSYRPTNRISLYGEDKNHFVDISLRHFKIESIRHIMLYIHEKRPDLEIPKVYLKDKVSLK